MQQDGVIRQEVSELQVDLKEQRRRLDELNAKFERDIAIINQKIRNTHKYLGQIHREQADEYVMDYRQTPKPTSHIVINNPSRTPSCCDDTNRNIASIS